MGKEKRREKLEVGGRTFDLMSHISYPNPFFTSSYLTSVFFIVCVLFFGFYLSGCSSSGNTTPTQTTTTTVSTTTTTSPSTTTTTSTSTITSTTTSTTTTTSGVGLNFTADSGTRIVGGSVPFVLTLDDNSYRMFLLRSGTNETARSYDGFTFTLEASGTVLGNGSDTTVLKIGSNYRIFYLDYQMSGSTFVYSRVKSATSETGLDFTQGAYTIYSGVSADANTVGVPDEIILPDGRIRMFYIGNMNSSNNVRTAISSDNGFSFTFEAGNICGDDGESAGHTYVDPDIIQLPDGNYRLYTMSSRAGSTQIYSFYSTDAFHFTVEAGVRLNPSDFTSPEVNTLFDPEALILPDGSMRLFCGAQLKSGGMGIVSATSNP